jgi:hypothetical protein
VEPILEPIAPQIVEPIRVTDGKTSMESLVGMTGFEPATPTSRSPEAEGVATAEGVEDVGGHDSSTILESATAPSGYHIVWMLHRDPHPIRYDCTSTQDVGLSGNRLTSLVFPNLVAMSAMSCRSVHAFYLDSGM